MERARALSDRVFAQIRPEAWLDRPIPERNRLLFYLGHLEAFDWNQIGRGFEDRGPVDATLDRLFAFGIDPPPGELPSDRPEDWPAIEHVRAYVQTVRRRIDDAIVHAPETLIAIAIEHRLMHVETLTYLLHALPYERRVVERGEEPPAAPPADSCRIEIPAGRATLGAPPGNGFAWDNEYDEHSTWVDGFAVDRYKVTNGQFLAFVEDGGDPPPFWTRGTNGWMSRGYDAERPLPLDHPVYATHEQAVAYAAWAGGTLPTEAQYHRYAFGAPDGTERQFPWGDASPSPERGSFDLVQRDTIPVGATPTGDSAFGVAQAVGNGWEWTRTPFAPFPGFAAHATYPGYSADFFDGRHFVLKGGSCATARTLLRRSFRNWFRPHYRHAYTAFRVVES